MSPNTVMLLIDADNVSIGVIEQAVAQLLEEFGALHVRRAYCTAESAVKHQAAFKRLGIRPMVNLATGKNSTDIALAVDALDLVLAERPAVVAIASSDSDFAPLVGRLREKGCRVIGLGQAGKTGEQTQAVYDHYRVLNHRAPSAAAPAPSASGTRAASRRRPSAPRDDDGARSEPAPPPAAPATAKASKTAAGRRRTAGQASSAPAPAPAPAAVAAPTPSGSSRGSASRGRTPATAPNGERHAAPTVEAILAALPALAAGETVSLRVAAERLRQAGLLSSRGTATKLLRTHDERFELQPARNPHQVRLKG